MIIICGIAGISLSPNDKKMNVREVATDLLFGIASRGPDATGAAWYDHESDAVKLTKIAVNTAKFLAARKEVFPETTPVMILHTRMATTGSKANRGNNHPIHHGNVIGVHNGVLWDHTGMFKDMGRKPLAEVDSEAIFALLNGGAKPEKVLNKVAGDAAIAWIDLEDPEVLHLARVVDRPLYIAQTVEGSLLFASTKEAVQRAAKNSGLTIEFEQDVEEGKYLKVVGGVIAEYLDIPGVKRNDAWSKKYAYTSGHGTSSAQGWDDSDDWDSIGTRSRTYPSKAATPGKYVTTVTPDGRTVTSRIADKPALPEIKNTTQWFSGKSTKELVSLVQSNSKTAVIELKCRGLDEKGELERLLSDNELVELNAAIKGGHRWAERQLDYRGILPDGTSKSESEIMDTDELVILAAGGSTLAVESLEARGFDQTGMPLAVKAVVV